MNNYRSIERRLLSCLIVLMLAAAALPISSLITPMHAEAASTVTLKSTKISGSGDWTERFAGGGYVGLCSKANYKVYNSKAYTLHNPDSYSKNQMMRKLAYYYGYQKGWTSGGNGCKLARAFNYVSTQKGNVNAGKAYHFSKSTLSGMVNAAKNVTVPSGFKVYFAIPTGNTAWQSAVIWKMEPSGYVTLVKTSSDSRSTAAGMGYSFNGIQYTVYSGSKSEGVLTCNAAGRTNTLTLPAGTYTVRETKTNADYQMNSKAYTVTVSSGKTSVVNASDAPALGTIKITKKVTGADYDGSLAFTFRLKNTANPNIVYTVNTNSAGTATVNVLKGTYTCEEMMTQAQMAEFKDESGTQRSSQINPGSTYTFNRINRKLRHRSLNISKRVDDGGSTEGFTFRVTGELYNSGTITSSAVLNAVKPEIKYDKDRYSMGDWEVSGESLQSINKAASERRTGSNDIILTNQLTYIDKASVTVDDIVISASKIEKTEEQGVIASGTLVKDGNAGYTAIKDAAYQNVFIRDNEETANGSTDEAGDNNYTLDQNATADGIRALLSDSTYFEKTDMSDVVVEVTVPVVLKSTQYVYNASDPDKSGYQQELSEQIVITGNAESEHDAYSVRYNTLDWYGAATVYQEIVNGKLTGNNYTMLKTDSAGNTSEITEGIQQGRFTVEEVMTDAQKARYRQPSEQVKEIRGADARYSFVFDNISRRTPVSLIKKSRDGNIAGIEFNLRGIREFDNGIVDVTAVTDEEGHIDFGNLYRGTYKITETGFDIENYLYPQGWRRSSKGLPQRTVDITGDEEQDIVIDIENIPTTNLYLTKVDKDTQLFLDNSAYELLEEGKKSAEFRIVRDDHGNTGIELLWVIEGSDIYADKPEVTPKPDDYSGDPDEGEDDTTVVTPDNDEQTPDEAVDEAEEATADEPVEYNYGALKGLKDGTEYTIRETTAPEGYGATINYTFTFEDGQKLVLENEAPKIGTTALDDKTGTHMSNADGMAEITDKVEYHNLTSGHEYRMTGRLVYIPETASDDPNGSEETETVKDADGREVVSSSTFTPKSADGTIDVKFAFDASEMDNRKTVILEELSDPSLKSGSDIIAVHVDPEYEGQSIYFPEIKTTATADDTRTHITEADNEVVITDVVTYSNIIAGNEYEMVGTLMNSETGEPVTVGGEPVRASQKFTAGGSREDQNDLADDNKTDEHIELTSGEVSLTFTFDGSALAGTSTVVFEKLYLNGKVVGEHTDINDKDQTVLLPVIGTKASRTGQNEITDRCSYSNLIPGERYVMFGYLVDKKNGSYIEDTQAQVEFTPDKPDGEVDVKFDIDIGQLRNHSVVAFERCYIMVQPGGEDDSRDEAELVPVASHQDINDEGQSVDLSESPKTGDRSNLLLYGVSMALSLTLILIIRRYRRNTGC